MNAARKELTRQIDALELYIDECTEPGPRRSSALGSLSRLREERDAMDRDQSDTLQAVLDFVKKLRNENPERLAPKLSDDETTSYAKSNRTLERERVAAELEALLEDHGVDIHAE